MNPQERGTSLDKFRFEYIVYGDFLCKSPYILATSAFWVPLSKLVKNVTRAKAEVEIEIFEGNMEAHRSDKLDELSSEDEEEDDEEAGLQFWGPYTINSDNTFSFHSEQHIFVSGPSSLSEE